MSMRERTPQQILDAQEQRKNEPFWLLSQSGFYEGIYGHSSLVFVAVKTNKHALYEAKVDVKDKTPLTLVIGYLECLQQIFGKEYPQVESISVGPIAILNIKDGEIPECSVVIQLALNGSVILARYTGETEEQALMNATVKGFREVVRI